MTNGYKCNYEELKNSYVLTITFCYNKFEERNQDELFNNLISCISASATPNNLTEDSIKNINKFLNLARHNSKLDIRNYLKEQ